MREKKDLLSRQEVMCEMAMRLLTERDLSGLNPTKHILAKTTGISIREAELKDIIGVSVVD